MENTSLTGPLSILGCDDAESRRQLTTLRQMAADTGISADLKEVRSYESDKLNHALFSQCYNSSANYDEVEDLFSRALTTKGWGSPEEKTVYGSFGFEEKNSRDLIFRNAEYSISIAYSPKDSSGSNYAISYIREK